MIDLEQRAHEKFGLPLAALDDSDVCTMLMDMVREKAAEDGRQAPPLLHFRRVPDWPSSDEQSHQSWHLQRGEGPALPCRP